MANIIDYVFWRGDLPISAGFPWNELDDLVMARISYLPLEQLPGLQTGSMTLPEAAAAMSGMGREVFHFREDPKLAQALAACPRYEKLTLSDFAEHHREVVEENGVQQEQFAAVTIHLPNREMYLSFRGTDDTLVGWKEDFNMAFQSHIPAQKEALSYAQWVAEKYPHEMLRLGGHSKGGNIAAYAALYMPDRIKTRLLSVSTYDAPGFMPEILEEKKEDPVLGRIHRFIPQESVVGRLLEMNVEPVVVLSESSNVHQHNVYNWQARKDGLVRAQSLTGGSEIMDDSLKQWLQHSTPEQRQVFVEGIYDVMTSTNARTMRELGTGLLRNIQGVFRRYKALPEEDRKIMIDMIQLFGRTYAEALLSYRKASGAAEEPAPGNGGQAPELTDSAAEGEDALRLESPGTDGP